jgi:hypothetical protein
MPKNDIGGFFVSLGLNPDKNSFETGQKLIDAVSTSLNKLIGTARNAAVVLATTAIATGAVESANYKTATKIGLTTEKLNELKAAAKIAGVNADGLVGSVGKLANVMNHLTIDGSGLEAYSKQLAELGMGFDELIGMDPAAAFEKIISTAQGKLDGTNMTRITTIVGDILGDAGADFFVELERQGKSIDQFMAGAAATQITNNSDNQKSQDFDVEVRTIQTKLESISKKLGAEVGEGLMPIVKGINDWLSKNGSTITQALENIGDLVSMIANSVIANDMGKLLSATIKLIAGDKKGALEDLGSTSIATGVKTTAEMNLRGTNLKRELNGIFGKNLKFEDLPADFQEDILNYYRGGGNKSWTPSGVDPASVKKARQAAGIKDGIIRPNGQIVQVASDDWVFAARNISDMAKAFMPQGMTQTSGPVEFTITQNFTISGSSDMPQVIRQQAYNGTQEGLLAVMNQSSRRMQLMSGTL